MLAADDFEAAGVYDPHSPNAASRMELLSWLVEQGYTIEQMTATRRGQGLDALSGGDILIVPGPLRTRAEAMERTGLSAQVMFVATDADSACRAAEALMSGFGTEGAGLVVLPRGGIAYGEVLVRGGDYYGSVVNLASRLADQAVPQELLVTEQLAESATRCTFEPAGRRVMKGFADPVTVQSLVTATAE